MSVMNVLTENQRLDYIFNQNTLWPSIYIFIIVQKSSSFKERVYFHSWQAKPFSYSTYVQ